MNKTVDTLPKFQTDYMFIRTVAESKTQPCITFVETRSGVVISVMCARKGGYEDLTKEVPRHFEACGFLNPVIIQSDKEMSVIDVCRKVARQRNAITVKSSEQRVCRSSARTPSGTRTMLPDTKMRRTLAYNFQQFPLPFHLQFVTMDLFSQDSQCDLTPESHSNICLELHRSRSASSQIDEQVDQWFLVGTRCIVPRTPGGNETWFT